MRAQPSADVRTGPGRGPRAVVKIKSRTPLSTTQADHVQELSGLEADIEMALEHEKHLARMMYRARRLTIALQVKRDHLTDIGDALTDRRAAT